MAELLTAASMRDVLQQLAVVFPARVTTEDLIRRASVYRDALDGHSLDAVQHAAKRVIQEDQYFPRPARLRALAREYDAFHRRSAMPDRVDSASDGSRCPSCGARVEVVTRYRILTRDTAPGGPIVQLSACGQFVLLEAFSRELCPQCAPACEVPHPDLDPVAMPLDQLTGYRTAWRRECTAVVIQEAA